MDMIRNRRSIRKYTNQAVSKETLHDLLEAGMCAPSAGNERPWHFVVVEERSQLEEFMKVHQYSRMLNEAPLAIVVCADFATDKYPGNNFWIQDCSAATENILLAAQEKKAGNLLVGCLSRSSSGRRIKENPESAGECCARFGYCSGLSCGKQGANGSV